MAFEARETVEALLDDLAKVDLTGHADRIVAACSRCTYAVLGEPGEAPSGESRVGGAPDLPHGSPWPLDPQRRPMRFVLQVNLSDLPDPEAHGLPSTGVLSLFVGMLEPATDLAHRVLLFEDVAALDRRQPPASDVEEDDAWLPILAPHGLTFLSRVDPSPTVMDDVVGEAIARLRLTDASFGAENEETEAARAASWRYSDVCGEGTHPARTVARIGGHHVDWDGSPAESAVRERLLGGTRDSRRRTSEAMARAAASWSNLVTLMSVDELDLVIWDAGVIQVAIHEVSLEARWFGSTYACVGSS